jgi:DNA repair protein RadA/Sms
MQCSSCGTEVREDRLRCPNPKCKAWVVQSRTHTAPTATPGCEPDGTVILSKVTSAEDSRIDVGFWNPIWGGGIVTTSTTLFAGTPGAGKSTGLLQILSVIAKAQGSREVLYVAAEECLAEVRMRADRIGIANQDQFRMVPAMKGVENLSEIMLRYKPCGIVLDSLNGLATDDAAMQAQLCKVSKEFAVELICPIIIISHVNKNIDIAGAMTLQHEVDMTAIIEGEGDDLRVISVKKNRFGRPVSMGFDMTAQGLVPARLDEDDEDETKSSHRKVPARSSSLKDEELF